MSITISNFYEASCGEWQEISSVPTGFALIFESKESTYYSDGEAIVRISPHWGSGIRQCNWYLRGYPKNNSFLWRGGKKIGIIALGNLIDIRL